MQIDLSLVGLHQERTGLEKDTADRITDLGSQFNNGHQSQTRNVKLSINDPSGAPDPPSLSSTSIIAIPASTHAVRAPATTTNANNHGAPSDINLTTAKTSDVDSTPTCPHCNRTFVSRIGLVSHLQIHPTETGEPTPGVPIYIR
ncbi:unnamed protein product [Schistocephalus solidus]|uniref:C2H2-type domain-containing protein n=1 Tax=Schistocephalus solidus TaxID=70667 RepID=A0A183SX95_SCHSO|nr:unnamed protein product [Schistocephalus solidus]